MHIVLANQWFPPESGWGGVAMYNWTIAQAFRDLGHQVTIVTSRKSGEIPAEQEMGRIHIHRLDVRDSYRSRKLPIIGRYARPLQQLNYSARVNHALQKLRVRDPFDVIEFADVNAEGFFYARAPQSAFVVRCHTPTFILARYYDHDELPYDTRIMGWCEKYAIRHAHARSAPSSDMARTVASATGMPVEKFAVIPNALTLDEFVDHPTLAPPASARVTQNVHGAHTCSGAQAQGGAKRAQEALANASITILCVARLERVKGVEILARAIPRVIAQVAHSRFIFIGDDLPTTGGGSQRAELEKYMGNVNVLSHVEFLTGADNAQLMQAYRQADICVVPSMLYESFSYTCAQAMAAGKPVVASRIGGIPETVDDGINGIIVPPGDVDALAEALIRLARDADLRAEMGRAGRAEAAREFDAVKVAMRTLALYDHAIKRFERGS